MHKKSSFVTLTYRDQDLPPCLNCSSSDSCGHPSLVKSHVQKFIRRLRKKKLQFRYFHCGEYGDEENTTRPHYHLCVLGEDFGKDREFHHKSETGFPLYTSEILNEAWQLGDVNPIGDLTFESAAYTARYVMKKITGPDAAWWYTSLDSSTGAVHERLPEYVTMSRRPGIGYEWFQKFKDDVYPSDEVIVRGKSCTVPRYYDRLIADEAPELFERIKAKRIASANTEDDTPERRAVREEVAEARVSLLKRQLT